MKPKPYDTTPLPGSTVEEPALAYAYTHSESAIEPASILRETWIEVDDTPYFENLAKLHKASKPISREKLQKTFDKLLGRR
jgi:hypothetical protein